MRDKVKSFVLIQDQLAVLQSACPNLPQERFVLIYNDIKMHAKITTFTVIMKYNFNLFLLCCNSLQVKWQKSRPKYQIFGNAYQKEGAQNEMIILY